MKWASDGIAISGLWTIASRLIRVARDVAQTNADGVLREAQHDVIGVDNMMWGSDFCDRPNPHGGWAVATRAERQRTQVGAVEPEEIERDIAEAAHAAE
jgi:hypothetical protein